MEIKKLTPMSLEVRLLHGEHKLLVMPDVHFDNPKCNRDLFFKLMDKAKEDNAYVLFIGDFFCLMNGTGDKRRSKDGIRPEYNKGDYIDLVINDAADKLAPYAKNILFMGYGNHETSVRKWVETDVLERLVERLNFMSDAKIQRMGYHGFCLLRFQKNNRQNVRTKTLFWHHGAFGGQVTKGVLGVMRHGAVTPDADIIVTGHTHDNWSVKQPRYRISKNTGEVKIEDQIHLKVGTLKEEFVQEGGWAVERLVLPKSMSGWWIDLNSKYSNGNTSVQISYSPAN